jgi:hypothetical protein
MVRWQHGQRTVGMAPIVPLLFYPVYGKQEWLSRGLPAAKVKAHTVNRGEVRGVFDDTCA